MRKTVSIERLKEVLDYNPETGNFMWRQNLRQRKLTSRYAGAINPNGYVQICIDQIIYKAHRLAWFYHYGKWPTDQIDHINGIKSDNRIANLRQADFSRNQANSKRRINNVCGYKGVCLHRLSGLYMARIMVDRENIFLGYFKTPELAHDRYLIAAKKYFGEFARAA